MLTSSFICLPILLFVLPLIFSLSPNNGWCYCINFCPIFSLTLWNTKITSHNIWRYSFSPLESFGASCPLFSVGKNNKCGFRYKKESIRKKNYISIYLYTLAASPSLGGSRQHKRTTKTMGISLRSSSNDEGPSRVWMALLEQHSPETSMWRK